MKNASSPRAKVFKTENRLAVLAKAPGGRTVKEALRKADERVASVRDQCLGSLGERADDLSRAVLNGPSAAARQEIYRLSEALFGVAASFGQKELAEAAYSLCDVSEVVEDDTAKAWDAICVHVACIRLLVRPDGADPAAALAGLRRVRSKFRGAVEA